jgi:hypothetical protein
LCLGLAALASASALAAGAAGAPAASSGYTAVLADCNAHGELTQSYTIQELEGALVNMPADMKQYTNCADVITRAQQQALANNSKSYHPDASATVGSSGSFLPTWLIVVLVVLALVGVTFAALAVRRRRES